MEKDNLLLTSIYQNTQTALQSFHDILPSIKSAALKKECNRQETQYQAIAEKCEKIAKARRYKLPDNNLVEKMRLWTSIKMSSMMDGSTRHMTEMLLFGTLMGLTQCIKDSADYAKSDEEILTVLKLLETTQEANLEKYKGILRTTREA